MGVSFEIEESQVKLQMFKVIEINDVYSKNKNFLTEIILLAKKISFEWKILNFVGSLKNDCKALNDESISAFDERITDVDNSSGKIVSVEELLEIDENVSQYIWLHVLGYDKEKQKMLSIEVVDGYILIIESTEENILKEIAGRYHIDKIVDKQTHTMP